MRNRMSSSWIMLVLSLLICVPAPSAQAADNPRIQLTLDSSEADRVLTILAVRRDNKPIEDAQWQKLFATEPYQRLKQREKKVGEQFHDPSIAFSDADFEKFVLSEDLLKRAQPLRETIDQWKKADMYQLAERILQYLPPSAVIRAKVYPIIKPGRNSFVWEASSNPAIFLYLDPEVSRQKFENTVAHELHHIGLASVESGYDRKIAVLTERAHAAAEWMGAFGEGFAMLAAAGGPDVDPHAASSAAEHARWDHDMANFSADLQSVNGFFLDILNGKFSSRDAIDEKAGTFFGLQGPWYTVGYKMAVMVEKRFGRPALIETMLDPRRLLVLYNQVATEQNATGKEHLPLWSDELLFTTTALARTQFWAPVVPPRAHYSIDMKFIADPSRLEGTETIRFRNDTQRPIGRIALQWFGDVLRVKANGVAAERAPGKYSVALFDLPQDVRPGGEVELAIEFAAPWKLDAHTGKAVTSFLSPHLWWGFGTLDDYEVHLRVPDGYAVATSGRYDPQTGAYRAEGARMFGLFVGKGYESAEADAGDVHVRAVFTPAGRPCAELLLRTAVDVIGFYRQQFGFYPHRSLSIVPGMDYPAGGYPPATGLIVIHGQERLSERPEPFWRWITAHEIGHMYWSNYVLAQGPDSLSWLMIGLGLHADRAYRLAHGIKGGAGALEQDYVSGVKQGLDTTMDVTEEQEAAIHWDFNNIVEHGKSEAFLNALESVIGTETFAKVYQRCLKEYAGKQLGWREFQRIAEIESGQDLGWFFDQWVRSSATAAYRVAGQECSPAGNEFNCTVRVERLGTMRMPVTVAARFEDGSEQRLQTDRLADLDELKFPAKSPLKEVVIEPDGTVTLAEAPPPTQRELLAKVRQMPWTGAGEAAQEAYRQARGMKIQDGQFWAKLGLMLYDGRYYAEALEVMTQLAQSDSDWRFAALVWQGHLLDLLGRRAEAVACYQEALKVPGTPSMEHSQYNLVIDKQWVEERLKTPFERK